MAKNTDAISSINKFDSSKKLIAYLKFNLTHFLKILQFVGCMVTVINPNPYSVRYVGNFECR